MQIVKKTVENVDSDKNSRICRQQKKQQKMQIVKKTVENVDCKKNSRICRQ